MDRTLVDAPLRLGRRDALDGVRALAVLAVMVRHAGVPGLPGGGSGVFVFFTLSGFLITTLLLQEAGAKGSLDLLRFSGRRLRRLAPQLLLMVLVVTVAGALSPHTVPGPGWRQVLETVTYCANWVRATGGSVGLLDHTWSLAVEEQFYLVWPLVVLLTLRWSGRRRAAPAVAVVASLGLVLSLVERVVLLQHGSSLERVYNGSDTEADSLLVGAAAAAVLQLLPTGQWGVTVDGVRRVAARTVVPGLLVLLLVLVAQPLPERPRGTHLFFTLGLTCLALSTAAVVLHVVLSPSSRCAHALSVWPLPRLGRLSYGVYLWHFPLFLVLEGQHPDHPWAVLLLGGCSAVLLAVLGHELVEKHLHRAGSA